MTDDAAPAAQRRPGRPPGRARRARTPSSVPFLTRTLTPFEVLGEEGLALIEHNADTILEEVGIEFRDDPEALELLRATPAPTSTASASASRAGCAAQIVQATAPREFTQHARNPAHNVQIGGDAHGLRARTTARRSCATSTTAAATARSRTSATS